MFMRYLPFVASVILFISAPNNANAEKSPFIPGEVVIGFHANVDGPDAFKTLETFNLSIKKIIFPRQSYILTPNIDNSMRALKTLQQSNLFNKTGAQPDGTLRASAHLHASTQAIKDYFSTSGILTVLSRKEHNITLTVSVNKGLEQKWINRLQSHPDVRFAVRNLPQK